MEEPSTQELVYCGPPQLVQALAACLGEHGVEVQYDPPLETRDINSALAIAAVVLAATGNISDILDAVNHFRQRFNHFPARVELADERESTASRLKKVDDLHEAGVISDQEKDEQRQRILEEL